jgi:hypothetical protein
MMFYIVDEIYDILFYSILLQIKFNYAVETHFQNACMRSDPDLYLDTGLV